MATHPPDLTPAALADALCLALPEADAGQLAALAEALLAASRRDLPPEAAQVVLQKHSALLRELSGREVHSGGVRLSFEGAQLGDLSIGDVAGRDVIKVSVAGLPNPYPELRPFTYTDRASFAGRERLVSAALAQLTTPGQEQTLLFVTGASGCGKSSFVQAGLLPALEAYYRDRALTVRHAVMLPSRQPLAALADALRRVGVAAGGPFAAAAPFALGAPVGEPSDVAVLLIDQCEELFTQSEPNQRDGLLELVVALPTFRDVRVHILCTLRSDFLGELAERRALAPVFRQQVLLWAMEENELCEAILRPIQQAYPDKRLEPALLDRLVMDVSGEAGYLPLLQVTLEELWRRGSMTLAFLSAGFALQQQHLAENRARIALGRQVLLRAEQDRLTDPDRAVLLRLEASRLLDEPARATTLGLLNILAGDPRLIAVLRGQVRSERNVRFSPDGRFLLSSGDDINLRVWDVASGILRQKYRFPHNGAMRSHFW